MTDFTREQLLKFVARASWEPDPVAMLFQVSMFALTLLDRAEKAEKRMKAWGCPDYDFICLNCGRETPCMTEADLGPGDPGVPCTFDLTYPQMIERLHYHEDKQRKAEAERDRLRAQLDSILANSDSLESGKLADANAEIARLREKLRAWQEKSDRHESERDSFRLEADRLREELLGAKVAWDMCDAVNRGLRAGDPKYAQDAVVLALKDCHAREIEKARLEAKIEAMQEWSFGCQNHSECVDLEQANRRECSHCSAMFEAQAALAALEEGK